MGVLQGVIYTTATWTKAKLCASGSLMPADHGKEHHRVLDEMNFEVFKFKYSIFHSSIRVARRENFREMVDELRLDSRKQIQVGLGLIHSESFLTGK